MVAKILIALGLAVAAFELIEHIVFPLVWLVLDRKRPHQNAAAQLIGRTAEVLHWRNGLGQIRVQGEIWRAIGEVEFHPGDRVAIRQTDGLTLLVARVNDQSVPDNA